jgi:hypothetical protein
VASTCLKTCYLDGLNWRASKGSCSSKTNSTWRTTCLTTKMTRDFPAIRLADAANIDSPTEIHQYKLKELAGRLDKFHSFTKGQFVKWKPGLRNRKFPDYGEPTIVTPSCLSLYSIRVKLQREAHQVDSRRVAESRRTRCDGTYD